MSLKKGVGSVAGAGSGSVCTSTDPDQLFLQKTLSLVKSFSMFAYCDCQAEKILYQGMKMFIMK
jgi:hypothetical protein